MDPAEEPGQPVPVKLRRPRPAVIVGLAVLVLLLTTAGVWAVCFLVSPESSIAERLFAAFFSAIFLLLPIRIAFVSLRRKLTTGSWKPSEEERLLNRAKWLKSGSFERADRWIAWSSPVLALIWAWLAFVSILTIVRTGHQTGWDWFAAIVWTLLAAREVWTIYRRSKQHSGKQADSRHA